MPPVPRYYAVSSGVDIPALFAKANLSLPDVLADGGGSTGNAAVAFVLYKLIQPLRFAVTVAVTPSVVALLRESGFKLGSGGGGSIPHRQPHKRPARKAATAEAGADKEQSEGDGKGEGERGEGARGRADGEVTDDDATDDDAHGNGGAKRPLLHPIEVVQSHSSPFNSSTG